MIGQITKISMGEFNISRTDPLGNAGWFVAGTVKWHVTFASGRVATIETEFENAPNKGEAIRQAAGKLHALAAALQDLASQHMK